MSLAHKICIGCLRVHAARVRGGALRGVTVSGPLPNPLLSADGALPPARRLAHRPTRRRQQTGKEDDKLKLLKWGINERYDALYLFFLC